MSIAKLAERFKLFTGAVLLALALVLGGCGGDVQEEQQDVQEEQKYVEEQQKEAEEEQPDIQKEQDVEPEQDVEQEK